MGFNRFEEILVWQKAKDLSVSLYRAFEESRDFGFRDQIQRASVSIMNNIAEGFERQTNREFRQFLYVAKGSCAEVRSMLYLATALTYLKETESEDIMNNAIEISKMLTGLINSIRLSS